MLRRLRSSASAPSLRSREQTLPRLALVGAGRQCHLPRVRRDQLAGDQPLPQRGLRLVARLGVRQEQNIAQLHGSGAVVLRQSVLVELGERRGQSLLHLRRQRRAPAGPVDGDELGELVGTLNDRRQRLGHQRAMRLVPRHLADQQQRRVTQLHLLARLDRQSRNLLRLDLRHQLSDAAGDSDTVLIELVLPQQAARKRAPQLQLRADVARGSALVRARDEVEIHLVQSGHRWPPFMVRVELAFRPESDPLISFSEPG